MATSEGENVTTVIEKASTSRHLLGLSRIGSGIVIPILSFFATSLLGVVVFLWTQDHNDLRQVKDDTASIKVNVASMGGDIKAALARLDDIAKNQDHQQSQIDHFYKPRVDQPQISERDLRVSK